MAIVQGKGHRWRIVAAHAGLVAFCALILFSLFMIASISFRPGNFGTGDIIPSELSFEHWKLALGVAYQGADGSLVEPPHYEAWRAIYQYGPGTKIPKD